MASEYLKQKYKDVKPDAPRELTKEEKRKNWWYYHKWFVVGGVVMVLFAADLVWNILGRGEPKPDCQIAYVGSGSLPDDTVSALEAGFASLCEDLNGDGKVVVTLRQYVSYSGTFSPEESSSEDVSPDEPSLDEALPDEGLSPDESLPDADPSVVAAVRVQLMADIMEQESFLFLLEDPESFQAGYHTLCRMDGSLPEEDDLSVEDCVLLWSQCPVLTEMELGEFNYDLFGGSISGSSQELLSQLYVGRRGFWRETDLDAGYASLWAKVIEGAAS